jgi:hypothetical protein
VMSSVSDGIYKDLKYPVQIAEVTFSNGTVGNVVFLLKHMFEALYQVVFINLEPISVIEQWNTNQCFRYH